jgi:hypothetical protein
VHLQGALTQTSGKGQRASIIGTLPAAARPSHDVYTIVIAGNGAYADLVIGADGQINVINPRSPAVDGDTLISLDGISYRR